MSALIDSIVRSWKSTIFGVACIAAAVVVALYATDFEPDSRMVLVMALLTAGGVAVGLSGHGKRIAPLLLLGVLVGVPACAGDRARLQLVAPAAWAAWPEVAADAERGIQDRVDDGEIGPGVAESRRERVRMVGESLEVLADGR